MPGNKQRSPGLRLRKIWHFLWAFSGWLVAILLASQASGSRKVAFLPGTYHEKRIPLKEVLEVNALHRPQLWTELLLRKQLEGLVGTEALPRTHQEYVQILGQAVEKSLSYEVWSKLRADFDSDPRIWEVWRISVQEGDFARLQERLQNQSVEQLEESQSISSLRVQRIWLPPKRLPQEAQLAPLGLLLGPQRQSNRWIFTQILCRGRLQEQDWLLYLGIRQGTDLLFQQISSGPVELPGYRFQQRLLEQVLQGYFRVCLTGERAPQTLPAPQ